MNHALAIDVVESLIGEIEFFGVLLTEFGRHTEELAPSLGKTQRLFREIGRDNSLTTTPSEFDRPESWAASQVQYVAAVFRRR